MQLPDPPPNAGDREWTVRYADLDRVGHVNNAAYFEALEDICRDQPPATVDVEFRGGLQRGEPVRLLTAAGAMWFVQDGRMAAALQYFGLREGADLSGFFSMGGPR